MSEYRRGRPNQGWLRYFAEGVVCIFPHVFTLHVQLDMQKTSDIDHLQSTDASNPTDVKSEGKH